MHAALTVAALAVLSCGCSGGTPERSDTPAPAPRAAIVPSESTLVADGGVTIALPEGEHRELVEANCTVCHSPALIMQQRLSRAKWDTTITWMQQTQNLWALEPEVRGAILDYLVARYGAEGDVEGNPEPLYLPNPVW